MRGRIQFHQTYSRRGHYHYSLCADNLVKEIVLNVIMEAYSTSGTGQPQQTVRLVRGSRAEMIDKGCEARRELFKQCLSLRKWEMYRDVPMVIVAC